MSTEDENRFAFDPFDPAQTQDQWEQLALLRKEAPVSRPIPGFVYVARYADVKAVFRDAETFSSREGFRGEGIVVPEAESFLGELDPPQHPRVRSLLAEAFRPGVAARSEGFAREFSEGRLSALADEGRGDLVSDFAVYLPAAVTAHALGVPLERIEDVVRWSAEVLHSTWPQKNATDRGEGLEGAFPEFAHFLDELIRDRRKAPDAPDDLITRMVRAKDRGRVLSAVQIRTICVNALLASQSTANLIGNLASRFLSDASFAQKLASQPARIPAAVEESLRFEPPVLFLFRTAMRDTQIGGHSVRAGERVLLGIASGNRDESVYDRADEFWLERGWPDVPEHLTFAPGPHFCLGSDLARMQARVVMETLCTRFEAGSVQLASEHEPALVPEFIEYGPARLAVEFASPMLEAPQLAAPVSSPLFEAEPPRAAEREPVAVVAVEPMVAAEPERVSAPAPELEPDVQPELEPELEIEAESTRRREPPSEPAPFHELELSASDELELSSGPIFDPPSTVDPPSPPAPSSPSKPPVASADAANSETEEALDDMLGPESSDDEEREEIDDFLSPPDETSGGGSGEGKPRRSSASARRRRRRR